VRRVAFCIFAAVVAGFGLATVLGLGTAAFTAAVYKAQAEPGQAVYPQVQKSGPAVIAAAVVGFVVGSGAIVWMFLGSRESSRDPEEPGSQEPA
jgi:hypothetical protein